MRRGLQPGRETRVWPLLPSPNPRGPGACCAGRLCPLHGTPTPRCSCLPTRPISGRVRAAADWASGSLGVQAVPHWVGVPVLLPRQWLLGGQVPPLGPAGTIQRRWGTGCWTELAFLPCQVPV